MKPKVSIIVLNWNKLDETKECVKSLLQSSYENFDILLVDNNSDDFQKSLFDHSEKVKCIVNHTNLGFAPANNQAMELAFSQGADLVWMVNNDTVIEANTLEALVTCFMENSDFGLASPLIKNLDDKKIQFAGAKYDRKTNTIYEAQSIDEFKSMSIPLDRETLLWGTALMISAPCFKKTEGFYPGYFAYFEDYDLSINALNNGFKCVVCTNSIIYHESHSGIRPAHYYYYTRRNSLYFWKRNARTQIIRLKKIYWSLAKTKELLNKFREAKSLEHTNATYSSIRDFILGTTGEYKPTHTPGLATKILINFILAFVR